MAVCTSCNRKLSQTGKGVRFSCPSCGEVEIIRCESCRKLSNTYTCPNCGFTGP